MNRLPIAVLMLGALGGSSDAVAQGLAIDRGGVRQPSYPEAEYLESSPVEQQPPAGFELPSAEPLPVAPMASVRRVRVDDIVIEDSTVFTVDELDAMTASYEGRDLSIEDLLQLRHMISQAYFDRGYVNSGVILPDQKVGDGVVVMRAIEGELTAVSVAGNRRLNDRYLTSRIENYLQDPLDINELQSSLQLLQQDPMVGRVNAQLLPGQERGQGTLSVDIVENNPFELIVAADNYRPPSVGEHEVRVLASYRSLTGNGDVLFGSFALSEGINDFSLSYAIPLSSDGLRLEAFFRRTDADIVEDPFDELDIDSELKNWGFTFSYPVIFAVDRTLTVYAGLERKESKSSLLGVPFSFGAGEVDGRAKATTLNIASEYSQRTTQRTWGARGLMQIGVDLFSTTDGPEPPNSEFILFLGQAQYLQRFGWRQSEFIVRGSMQLANDPVFAMYKLSVGGRFSVRGYRENFFVRDNGAYGTLEFQIPLLLDSFGVDRFGLRGAVFTEYGAAWDADGSLPTSNKDDIWGAGIGLIWNRLPWLQVEAYWGADLIASNAPSNSWQDQGFNYQLRLSGTF